MSTSAKATKSRQWNVSESQARALTLLASSPNGVTEALLMANGVSIDTLVDLINCANRPMS
jgi:hypothetical protein